MNDKRPPQQEVVQSSIARKGAPPHTEIIGVERGPESIQIDREEEAMWAEVEIGLGMTINLGDFNSMRVDLRLRRPCRNTDAAIDGLAHKIRGFLHKRLDAEADQLMAVDPGQHIRGSLK